MTPRTERALGAFTLALLALWGYLAAHDWALPFPERHALAPEAISAELGSAYVAPVPAHDKEAVRAVVLEGWSVPNEPLAALAWITGETYLHHHANAYLKHRFPELGRRIAWRDLGPGAQQHEDIRRRGAGRYSDRDWNAVLFGFRQQRSARQQPAVSRRAAQSCARGPCGHS
jgi:hypothetical protein